MSVLFTVFVFVPIIGAFVLSLLAWNLNGTPTWVGLANYKAMLDDPLVRTSVENTLLFVVMGVVPTVFIGLWLAMLINFPFRGVTIVRSLYLVPAAVSLSASAVIWQYIYEPRFGLLSYIFAKVGIRPPARASSSPGLRAAESRRRLHLDHAADRDRCTWQRCSASRNR